MSLILKIGLVLLGMYLLRRIAYLGHVLAYRKSKDVTLSVKFLTDQAAGSNAVAVWTPFYDEKKHFYLGLELRGLHIGFTPYETMREVLREYFKEDHLVQVAYDFWGYPNVAKYPGLRSTLTQDGVEVIDGALIYDSEAIKRGCVEHGITDGADIFWVCPPVEWDKKSRLKGKTEEWKKLESPEAYREEKEFFNSEGELSKLFEHWQLNHNDDSRLLDFANAVLKAAIEKLFRINGMEMPLDFTIPKLETAFNDIFVFSGKDNVLKIYFEDDSFVIYREQGKTYETYIQKIGLPRKKDRVREFVSYLIPEIVEKKVYSKKRLRKLGVKFIILCGYLLGVSMVAGYLNSDVLRAENMVLMGVMFLSFLFIPISMVLSIYYLFLGIFGRKRFMRAGI